MNGDLFGARDTDTSESTPRPALSVHGGAGGTVARLDDLDRVAARLRELAGRLGTLGGEGLQVLGSPSLLVTVVSSPVTFVAAESALASAVSGPQGMLAFAVRVEIISTAMSRAADLYRAWDAATSALMTAVRVEAGVLACLGGGMFSLPLVAVSVVTAGDAAPAGPATLVEVLCAAAPALVTTVAYVLPGGTAVGAALSASAGTPWPPSDVSTFAALVVGAASLMGVYRDPEPTSVRIAGPSRRVTPPRGVADVVDAVPTGTEPQPVIRVVRVTALDGSAAWIVGIPGTRDWSLDPGGTGDPFDVTGNVRTMAGSPTAARRSVEAALVAAGVAPGEPVMLAGHSQGGMVAAAVAADPVMQRRYRLTHVLTSGAPISSTPVPDGVQALSLEHSEDPVPRLDGRPNPDRVAWVTVTASAAAGAPTGGGPFGSDDVIGPLAAHAQSAYVSTASLVDASTDPSIVAWREGAGVFLDRPGARAEVIDVVIDIDGTDAGTGGGAGVISSRAGGTAS